MAVKKTQPKNGTSNGKAIHAVMMRLTDDDKERVDLVLRRYVLKPPTDNPKPVDNLTEVFRYLLRKEEERLKTTKPSR
jgi:hypothetical protein